jgi:hypothetical protein
MQRGGHGPVEGVSFAFSHYIVSVVEQMNSRGLIDQADQGEKRFLAPNT